MALPPELPSPALQHIRPHAVVFPYPVQGHITPMMQLSKRLAARGFTITFVTTDYRLSHILRAREQLESLPTSPEKELLDIRLEGLPDGLPPDDDRNPVSVSFVSSVDSLHGEFEELLQRLSREAPTITCIISDSFLPWTQDLADKWRIPRVFFWTQSTAVFAAYASTAQLVSNGYVPFKDKVKAREATNLFDCIPGLPPMHPHDLPFNIKADLRDATNQWLSQILDHQFRRRNEAIWVIGNSFNELESNVVKALEEEVPKYLLLGPLIPSAFLEGQNHLDTTTGTSLLKEEECFQWLDTQEESSVLYISFGSVVTPSAAQFQEIAMGLLASRQQFLWVTRSENMKAILPEFLDCTKDQGRVITWAPQTLVLSHSAIGGFLTHCGWNSIVESVSMGVPLLGLPHYLDQFTNCWFIAYEWKIGLELRRGKDGMLEREELERGVRILMQGEDGREMRSRAAKLRNAARRAVQMQGSTETNLQLFVEDITRRAQSNLEMS